MKEENSDTSKKIVALGRGTLKLVPTTNKTIPTNKAGLASIPRAKKFPNTSPQPISNLLLEQIFADLAMNTDAVNDVENPNLVVNTMKMNHVKKNPVRKNQLKKKDTPSLPNIHDIKGWQIYGKSRMPPHEND